jgi:transcriptional regulator with XRE-family HTH domain
MSKLLSIEFGLALRDARLRAGLTQRDVAKRARLRQTYISRVELGDQNLTLASMVRLARAVGLGVSLAITGDDHPTPPTMLPGASPSGPSPITRRSASACRSSAAAQAASRSNDLPGRSGRRERCRAAQPRLLSCDPR